VIRLLMGYTFNSLNVNRVKPEALKSNERAQICYRKVGFKEVGIRRKAKFVNGKYSDAKIMDVKEQMEKVRRNQSVQYLACEWFEALVKSPLSYQEP
jgi:RimJ/RimL family protein N-acetyltransferase